MTRLARFQNMLWIYDWQPVKVLNRLNDGSRSYEGKQHTKNVVIGVPKRSRTWDARMASNTWYHFWNFLSLYRLNLTCQLSCFMRQSHACRSKIVTSRIQTNFSLLTDNSKCTCLKSDQIKNSIHFSRRRNSLIMLKIGWKSFGNRCRPCFYVIKNLSTPLVNTGSCRKIFGSRWKPLVIFGSLSKSSAIFGSHQ